MTKAARVHGAHSGEDGFTIMETLMVIVLLGIVGSAILMYFAGIGSSADQVKLTQAAILCQEKMETIMADKKATSGGFSNIVSEASAPLGAPFSAFSREVEAYCVQEAALDTSSGTMPDCADSDIRAKRVRVRVSWQGGYVDTVTVVTRH
jgi:prepilin-type N-terminal cleavage/methylation domain-containing protein